MSKAPDSAVKQIYKLNSSKSGIDPAMANGTDKGGSKRMKKVGTYFKHLLETYVLVLISQKYLLNVQWFLTVF